MRKSWALCVLLGITMAWGQAASSAPEPPQAPAMNQPRSQGAAPDASSSVPDTAAVITINGVCPPQSKPAAPKAATAAKPAGAAKTPAAHVSPADCKTVITKAQFEKLAASLAPTGNVSPQLKRQLAGVLPRVIAMSDQAKKQGMDKTDQYKETMKFMQMQVLAQELQRKIQADSANVSDSDMQKYYDDHKADFEQYNLDRLFVPRTKQPEPDLKQEGDKNSKPTEDEIKTKQEADKAKAAAAEQSMTKLADDLRVRAAAGEDFTKLQKEAFEAAGMKIESPTVNLANVRRTGLSPGHVAVFDLKPGEVSQVISDNGGHYIYKMNSKSEIPLDQAKNEIHGRLQSERMRDTMDKLNGSFQVETNEAYFGPGAGGVPPRPGPGGPARPMGARPGTPPPSTPQQTPPPPGPANQH
jgi:hypothetical protein